MEQARTMGLPTAPAKATDNRTFEGQTVQAEAIPPDQLAAILRGAIEGRQDDAARTRVLDLEAAERLELVTWARGVA